MLKPALALAAILISVPAHAASFSCSASILDYAFYLTGNISGARVMGAVHVRVTKSGQLLRQGAAPASGRFVANQRLSFVAQDPHAHIAVSTTFQGGGIYSGTAAIQSDQGNVNLSTSCRVR